MGDPEFLATQEKIRERLDGFLRLQRSELLMPKVGGASEAP